VRPWHRKRAQQDLIGQREDRRIGADAEGESDDRESRVPVAAGAGVF
jgi:hypothetical protein